VLGKALAQDAGAVNNLFSQTTTGLSALTKTLADRVSNSVDGTLISRRKGLNQNIKGIDDQLDRMQLRLESFRQGLIAQFTAMEKVVSGLKSVGNFLTQQSQAGANK
jgi:flagellar hook-associated protein 2